MTNNNSDPKAAGNAGAQGQHTHPLDQYSVQPQNSDSGGEKSPYYKSQVPTIALPKGGGALKGIDEKFSVNAVNGTASLQVSLPLSPGRSGFTPALSLSYNSGGGNSEFGLGWGLGLPAIQRKTDKKLPTYQDAAESDTFLLAGAEDMVPTLKEDGSVFEETITDGNGNTLYHVKRYRPRIEGLFARIERISEPGNTHTWWRVTTKDNMTTYYGLTPAACIADPADAARIFKWLPQLSIDNRGNVQEFFYVEEDIAGVPKSAHERNRLKGLAPFTNKYLKTVRYCNKNPYFIAKTSLSNDMADINNSPYKPELPADPVYLMEAVFDYGDHSGDIPGYAPDQAWTCRKDPFSDFHAGFEIRTYRKCRRVLMFHSFRELNEDEQIRPVLVRSLDLSYMHDTTTDDFTEADIIVQAAQTGYKEKPGGGWYKRSLPPMVMDYQPLAWDTTIHTVSKKDAVHAPQGLTGAYQWIDLYGEGISGILNEQNGAWYYKSNLGNGRFTPAVQVAEKPSFSGLGNVLQWQDLDADGRRQLVSHDPSMQGYFELEDDDTWQPFRHFETTVNIDWNSPYTKMLDLDGDGRPDLLLTEERAWTWYQNKGSKGIIQGGQASTVPDDERGPRLVLNDEIQRIFLADMNGDGLTDIVRIMNGEVCYWPNKGYGLFGAKVSMSHAPLFSRADEFNPAYLHLADISGTGAPDMLYRNADGSITAWINQAGNAWSAPVSLGIIPATEQQSTISVLDFLGNGTGCIVWSSPLPQYESGALRYMDLMGGTKPYILRGYHNSMGKSVAMEYKSSVLFYLEDKAAGTPWATKLPFPVQCLERVTTTDAVSETSFSQRYSYHHGYYDHEEREFRGFGRVDAVDIDGPLPQKDPALAPEDIVPHQDPVLTKTWYHTGAWLREHTLLDKYEQEYFPFAGNSILTCAVEDRTSLSARELREAYRALKGAALRQEVYALDGSDQAGTPYSITATAYTIRLLQRAQPASDIPPVNGFAVFLSYQQQSLSWSTERKPDDARVAHSMALHVDVYGNVLESASVVYPRRSIPGSLPAVVQAEQSRMHITYSVSQVASFRSQGYADAADCDLPAHYRLRIPCGSQAYEITGLAVPEQYWDMADLYQQIQTAVDIDYTATASGTSVEKKLLSCSRVQYYIDGVPGDWGYYDIDAMAYREYTLAFTDDVLAASLGSRVSNAMLTEGGYYRSADIDGFPAGDPADWIWLRGGTATYDDPTACFMLPVSYSNTFDQFAGGISYWSDYYMLPAQVWDALDNHTQVLHYDWRLLQPLTMKDANDNISEICYDVLGMAVATAIKGKGTEADYLQTLAGAAIDADSNADMSLQDDFWSDPEANAKDLLGRATWRCLYNLDSLPTSVAMIAREEHYADNAASEVLIRLSYGDAFGRVAMHKAQATDDPVSNTSRWIGSGKTIYNNKGSVVMQFEPYYSPTHAYDPALQAANLGISPRMYYDPLGRAYRTEAPDGTYSYTHWDGWSQTVYDANDTTTGNSSMAASDWYTRRMSGALGAEEQDAAAKAAQHANTPAVAYLDSLGRGFYTIQHNRRPDSSGSWTDEYIHSYAVMDLVGNRLAVVDGLGRTQLQYRYSQLKAPLWQQSIDGGEGRALMNAAGQPYYAWDATERKSHISYDILLRPETKSITVSGTTTVLEQTIYGEDSTADNMRGQVWKHYDTAGLSYVTGYDFKGVPHIALQALISDKQGMPDWTTMDDGLLETELYGAIVEMDALGRPHAQQTNIYTSTDDAGSPNRLWDAGLSRYIVLLHDDTGKSVTTYDKAGVPITTGVENLRGQNKNVVTDMRYNAKGQTEAVWYGNGTKTSYTYDPQNYRVRRILTVKLSTNEILQDLNYFYDAAGNITQIQDDAQQTLFYNNSVVTPDQLYTYDALYRLIKAEGREQIGTATFGAADNNSDAQWQTSHKGDGAGVQRYIQTYSYDVVGNILELKHTANSGSYTRTYTYTTGNNRLASTTVGTDTYSYTHDAYGNMTGMPHLDSTTWNLLNEMSSLQRGTTTAYYQYAGGNRIRKYIDKGSTKELRLYIGNLEIYRKFDSSSSLILERTTLHAGAAMYEERTIGTDDSPEHLARFSYSNHLGSAALELDETAAIISYEEYHPYGTTSYQAMNATINATAKRYRYTGKERDEESGLYYHGARYYACWLARWTAVDPLEGKYAPLSAYNYCSGNPISKVDPDGMGEHDVAMGGWYTKTGGNSHKYYYAKGATNQAQLDNLIGKGKGHFEGTVVDGVTGKKYYPDKYIEPIGTKSYGGKAKANSAPVKPDSSTKPNESVGIFNSPGVKQLLSLTSSKMNIPSLHNDVVHAYVEPSATQKFGRWLSEQSVLSPFAWATGHLSPPQSAGQDLGKELTYFLPIIGSTKGITESVVNVASGNTHTGDFVNIGLSAFPYIRKLKLGSKLKIVERSLVDAEKALNAANKVDDVANAADGIMGHTLVIDEQLSPSILDKLQKLGFAVTTPEKGTLDPSIIKKALSNGEIVFTNNIKDFRKSGVTVFKVTANQKLGINVDNFVKAVQNIHEAIKENPALLQQKKVFSLHDFWP